MSDLKYQLETLVNELQIKKLDLQNYLLEIEKKIQQIQSQINNIDTKDKDLIKPNDKNDKIDNKPNNSTKSFYKKIMGSRMTNEYEYSGDEYDSDDPDDRLYLMDLPKLFSLD